MSRDALVHIKAGFDPDVVAEIRKDLESVRVGLGRRITTVLRRALGPITAATIQNTQRGRGPSEHGRTVIENGVPITLPPKDVLPHIADTISGSVRGEVLRIVTSHPGGPVLEYGGRVAPRGTLITVHTFAMAHRAGEARVEQLVHDVESAINALLTEHGLA
jgi:hypothetical protein